MSVVFDYSNNEGKIMPDQPGLANANADQTQTRRTRHTFPGRGRGRVGACYEPDKDADRVPASLCFGFYRPAI